jgi:uncharacterized protein (DUF1697 family)
MIRRYAVFLRAVNVGGHSPVKMEDLCRNLANRGLKDISSYRQSGNLAFGSSVTDEAAIGRTVKDTLEQMTGAAADIFLRRMEAMEELVTSDPFKGVLSEGDRGFATFMSARLANAPSSPVSFQEGISMIGLIDDVALTVVRKDVFSGPVNDQVENAFGVRATTRNWSTVTGLVKKTTVPRSK